MQFYVSKIDEKPNNIDDFNEMLRRKRLELKSVTDVIKTLVYQQGQLENDIERMITNEQRKKCIKNAMDKIEN